MGTFFIAQGSLMQNAVGWGWGSGWVGCDWGGGGVWGRIVLVRLFRNDQELSSKQAASCKPPSHPLLIPQTDTRLKERSRSPSHPRPSNSPQVRIPWFGSGASSSGDGGPDALTRSHGHSGGGGSHGGGGGADNDGGFVLHIPSATMALFNTGAIILLVPLYDKWVLC